MKETNGGEDIGQTDEDRDKRNPDDEGEGEAGVVKSVAKFFAKNVRHMINLCNLASDNILLYHAGRM